MDAIKTGCCHTLKILVADPCNCMGPGIGGDSFCLREGICQVLQNCYKVIRFYDQAVGILEKYGLHPVADPGQGSVKGHRLTLICVGADAIAIFNAFNRAANEIDVAEDMVYRAQTE